MKVLLDVGVSPRLRQPLQQQLDGVAVESAVYHDWRSLPDNELLAEAERGGFTTLVTTDKRMAEEHGMRPSPSLLSTTTASADSWPPPRPLPMPFGRLFPARAVSSRSHACAD